MFFSNSVETKKVTKSAWKKLHHLILRVTKAGCRPSHSCRLKPGQTMIWICLQVFETGSNASKTFLVLWAINKENAHKKQNSTYWWDFLPQFGLCAQECSPAPLSWTVQRPRQQLGKRTLWHFLLGNKTEMMCFYKGTSTHDHKHNKHICEQLTAQYWDRPALSNNLSPILMTEFLVFLLWNTVPCAAPLFLASIRENSFCGVIFFHCKCWVVVHMCIYVTIYELNMLRYCKAAWLLLSANTTVKAHIQMLKWNQPLISLKFLIATKCKKNNNNKKNPGNGEIISSSQSNISPCGSAIFTSFAVIYLFWLRLTSILPASPWQNGWHPALSFDTRHLTGQTMCNNFSRSTSPYTYTVMLPVFSVSFLTLPRLGQADMTARTFKYLVLL